MKSTTIIIGGDLVPTESNMDLFTKGDVAELVGLEMLEMLASVDYRIFNLECPLTDIVKPIPKCGPNLKSPLSSINAIKALNPQLISLANNHILDQDEQGLLSTIEQLDKYKIAYVGAGRSLDDARKAYIIVNNNSRIGIYSCAEHEFTIAKKNKAGANPFDPFESLDDIQELKSKCDYVIVLYHGGKEYYRYPSPYLQKICRKMAKKGADLIICQHSHSIGCFEEYDQATIVYGQGNFLFDYSNDPHWETSLLLRVNIRDNLEVEYIPIIKLGKRIRLASDELSNDILTAFKERSAAIQKDGFIEQQYRQFALSNIASYLRIFAGYSKWTSRIDRHIFGGLLLKRQYNRQQLLAMKNFIECEAHKELILSGLEEQL
ncbi:CapA family protein [Anaerospora sp.]|uniref:CapA family protein n=1 Tax=Anaerospora sp. TaxID=1960278 RepID=UPI0028A2CC81|nr:CapA family protein [Anaerospora sp.]